MGDKMKLYLEKNMLSIDNYNQIIDVRNDLIEMENVTISGDDLKIIYVDKYKVVINGVIKKIKLGDI